MKVGETYTTNRCGCIIVVAYKNRCNVTVQFNDGTKVIAQSGHIRNGAVSNPYQPSVYNVGFIGYGQYTVKSHHKHYSVWHSMLMRSYDAKCHKRQPTYIGCTVAKRWHNFQNFASDYEQMIGYGNEGWQLDKDILYRDNCNYSRKTTVLVPQHINSLLTKHDNARGNLPIGVRSSSRNTYNARLNIDGKYITIGRFKTPERAFQAYKQAKEAEIQRVAKLYKNQIDPRAYHALMKYKVRIDD